MFRIINFLPFIFLILIPFLVYISRKSLVAQTPSRKAMTFFLRTLALCLIILALADIQLRRQSDILSVIFAVDASDSISETQREIASQFIKDTVKHLKDSDEFGIIPFATDASISVPLQPKIVLKNADFSQIPQLTDSQYTNLSSAVRLCITQFPESRQKRIVLISDGNQNVDDVRELVDVARASGVEIGILQLNPDFESEVIATKLLLPHQVRVGEPFDLKLLVESVKATKVSVCPYRNSRLLDEPKVYQLTEGKQLLDVLSGQRIKEEGTYEYRVEVAAEEDTIRENNTLYGSVSVRGRAKVLYVVGLDANQEPDGRVNPRRTREDAQYLQTILKDVDTTTTEPKLFPNNPAELYSYDAIILDDIHADDLSHNKMKLIKSFVQEMGRGLIAIGGDSSFGNGGYFDTPLERTLPVEMNPEKKQSLALCLVMDKSGSMANSSGSVQKIALAVRAARDVIEALDEEDFIGVIVFDSGAKEIIRLQRVNDKERLADKLREIKAGGGTAIYPALKRAHKRLKDTDAKQKHVVVLSDGKSSPSPPLIKGGLGGDFIGLAQRMREEKITISTIAIGDADKKLMQEIAKVGNGRYKYVADVSQLPEILVKEVRQPQDTLVEEVIQPRIVGDSGILTGITSVPKLKGYVATSARKIAQVPIVGGGDEHPILATWRYGLGKSVAFTSDVQPRWATEWIKWDNFGKFWTQTLNWVLPSVSSSDFDLAVSISQGEAIARLDSIDESGQIEFEGIAKTPDATSITLDFRQLSSAQYEARFDAKQTGAYQITVKKIKDGGDVSQQYTNLSVSYSPEFATLKANTKLMREVVDKGNGIFNPTGKELARHSGTPEETYEGLWKWFLLCAALLFPLELAIRRISVTSTQLKTLFSKMRLIKEQRLDVAIPEHLSRLRQRKVGAFSEIRRTDEVPTPVQAGAFVSDETKTEQGATVQSDAPSISRLLEAKGRALSDNSP